MRLLNIVSVSVHRKQKGLLKWLDGKSFTAATTQNIDFLQSHASVYSGSDHRNWHGITAQVVQPRQKLKTVIGGADEVAGMNMSLPHPSSSTLVPATYNSHTSMCTSRDQPVSTVQS